MTLDSLPDLEYKRVVSCKDSSHATDVLAVSEHGAPGRRPNIHTHCRPAPPRRSEEHTSELQSLAYLVCRLLLEKKKTEIKQPLSQTDERPGRRQELHLTTST